MAAEGRAPRLAVLIDAENATPRIAEALFTEIATLGEASARRIYGDFASSQIQGWTRVLARFAGGEMPGEEALRRDFPGLTRETGVPGA